MIYICKYAQRLKGGCKDRVRKDILSGEFCKDGSPHNHPPEREEQRLLEAVNAATEQAGVSREQPRQIFDRVRRQ